MKNKTKGNHWMVKQEPETYSWADFVKDGKTDWTGVRNYQARNNLREMKTGERVSRAKLVEGMTALLSQEGSVVVFFTTTRGVVPKPATFRIAAYGTTPGTIS